MGEVLLAALGLMLVFEGLMPFMSPAAWREWIGKMAKLTDGQLRFVGLASVLLGVLLLWLSR